MTGNGVVPAGGSSVTIVSLDSSGVVRVCLNSQILTAARMKSENKGQKGKRVLVVGRRDWEADLPDLYIRATLE